MNDDVAAVLDDVLQAICSSQSVQDEMVVRILDHLAWHRIACVYVPEGVAVEHGARLVWVKGIKLDRPAYVFEDTP